MTHIFKTIVENYLLQFSRMLPFLHEIEYIKKVLRGNYDGYVQNS